MCKRSQAWTDASRRLLPFTGLNDRYACRLSSGDTGYRFRWVKEGFDWFMADAGDTCPVFYIIRDRVFNTSHQAASCWNRAISDMTENNKLATLHELSTTDIVCSVCGEAAVITLSLFNEFDGYVLVWLTCRGGLHYDIAFAVRHRDVDLIASLVRRFFSWTPINGTRRHQDDILKSIVLEYRLQDQVSQLCNIPSFAGDDGPRRVLCLF